MQVIDIDHIFKYHPPTSNDLGKYEKLREAGKEFARIILETTPKSADQTHAIRLVREAIMTANASIALGGRLTMEIGSDEELS